MKKPKGTKPIDLGKGDTIKVFLKTLDKKKIKVKFDRGVKRINFPIFFEGKGGSMKEIEYIMKTYDLPKFSIIGYERVLCYKKGLEYDLKQVYIEK